MRSLAAPAASLSLVTALVLAGAFGHTARAASGAHASYFSESAFMTLAPGQSGQFAVGFVNAGDVTWTKSDEATRASLHTAAPLDNTVDFNGGWGVNWISPNIYAFQSADGVAPGSVGYLVYTVQAPLTAASGPHTFYGRLFVGTAAVEDFGYYQIATVAGAAVLRITGAVPASPSTSQTPTVSGAGAASGVVVTMLDNVTTTVGSATAAADGTFNITVSALAVGTHSLTARTPDGTTSAAFTYVVNAAAAATPAPATGAPPSNSTRPSATGFTQPGQFSILVGFSKAMDPATATTTNVRWDGAAFPGNLALQTTGTSLRLDFSASSLPGGGAHTLDLLDGLADTTGLKISPSITTYSVTIPVDTTAPSISTVTAASPSTVEVTFSEPMRTTANGFASGVSVDVPGSWSILTSSGGSTGISVTTAVTGGTSSDADIFAEKKVRLALSGPLTSASFQAKISGVADLAGNVVSPNPATGSFSFSGIGGGAPGISSTTITAPTTSTPLQTFAITFSKPMSHNASQNATAFGACAGGGGQIDNRANYSSTPADLGNAINDNTTLCQIGSDERTVTFQFKTAAQVPPVMPTGTATAAGTYTLTVSSVTDSSGTPIAASTTTTVSGGSPAVKSVAVTSSTVFTVTVNTKVDATSARNPGSYQFNSNARSVLCTSSATASINVDNSGTLAVVTITCSTAGTWGTSGTVVVWDVTQLSTGITIAPNPNPSRSF